MPSVNIAEEERTNIHMCTASNWLRKSMVGLFERLTLFVQLGLEQSGTQK